MATSKPTIKPSANPNPKSETPTLTSADPSPNPPNPSQQKPEPIDVSKTTKGAQSSAALVSPTASSGSGPNIQKKVKRAERFGVPVQLSEEKKRSSRAERFGTASGLDSKSSEENKRKARAERFGLPVQSATNEDVKKKARLARFAAAPTKADPAEDEKRKAREMSYSECVPAQAVATSSQPDLDHYMDPGKAYEKDWMQKDLKINLVRALVAVDAQERMFVDMEKTAYDRLRDNKDLKLKKRELQDEKHALHSRINHDKEILEKAVQRAEVAEKELALIRTQEDDLSARIKEMEAELQQRRNQEGEDLERIRAAHFDSWVDEWVTTKDGSDWVYESSKCARVMGYWDAVQNAKTHYPEVDVDSLMRKLTGCEGVSLDAKGQAYFISDPEDAAGASSSAVDLVDLFAVDEEYNAAVNNSVDLAWTAEGLCALQDCGFDIEGVVHPDTHEGVERVVEQDLTDEKGRVEIRDHDENPDHI